MSEPLRVDVVFDFVCPWCYIGKRRLESVLEVWKAEHPGDPEPVVRWLPFQLNPDIPAGGISRREHMERKHGPAGPSPKKQEHVAVWEGAWVSRSSSTGSPCSPTRSTPIGSAGARKGKDGRTRWWKRSSKPTSWTA